MRELIRGAGEDEGPADPLRHDSLIAPRHRPRVDRLEELFGQVFGQIVLDVRRAAFRVGHERVAVVAALACTVWCQQGTDTRPICVSDAAPWFLA